MEYKILKLPLTNPSKWQAFEKQNVVRRDYVAVYKGEIEEREDGDIDTILEDLFVMFNVNHPKDYYSSSLSVSDVIEITKKNEKGKKTKEWYYVNDFGFGKLDWKW